MEQPCLSVIVPAYNEEATIQAVVTKLLDLAFVKEIIIIDDCSIDKTAKIAEELCASDRRVKLLRHNRNQGKTEALKTGFRESIGDVVIVQDADLEYDPQEIRVVIEPIIEGQADVCYGSRFLVRKASRVLYFYHYLANKFLTFLSNVFTNLNMTDIETGYKAFRGEIIRSMTINSKGFGFEVEVTAKIAKLTCAIYEVPISYYGRTYEEGKKIGMKDGIAAIWYIIKYNVLTTLKMSYTSLPDLHKQPSKNPVYLSK